MVLTNVWLLWCYLCRADGMGCHHRRLIRLIKVGSVCSVCITSLGGECLALTNCVFVCACVPSPVSSSVLHSPVWPTSNLITEMKRQPISPLCAHLPATLSFVSGPRWPQTGATGVHLWVAITDSFSNYYCSSYIFLMGLLLIEGVAGLSWWYQDIQRSLLWTNEQQLHHATHL